MKIMNKKLLAVVITVIIVGALFGTLFSGFFNPTTLLNKKPEVQIQYPEDNKIVSNLVMVSGIANDPDGISDIETVEIKINDEEWTAVDGIAHWSYDWNTFEFTDGNYSISARAWDGIVYSGIITIRVRVDNPDTVPSDTHKWAIFIAAANFPPSNESKLGNGGLFLAEKIAAYLIETDFYATSNIVILFDDGWIRSDNGYGERTQTLQERHHRYDITYGGATKKNVIDSLNHIIEESNKFSDSEIFIWIFNHGYGDENKTIFGGKLFESSLVFIWNDTISDKELGTLLHPLKSHKVCIMVDACYSGGFSDKSILNLPTSILLRSGIPQSGRIVISGTSKFRQGYTSTTEGPLFSQLWFEGLITGKADGFKPWILKMGRPTLLRMFKDSKVSVEEAFYYAKYTLRTDKDLKEYKSMEPQINDEYPHKGFIRSRGEMFL